MPKKQIPVGGTGNMNFDIATVSSYVTRLNKASQELRQKWLTLSNITIKQVQNSWAGKDASEYIESVLSQKDSVEAMCMALDLLAKTYSSISRKLSDYQEEMIRIVREAGEEGNLDYAGAGTISARDPGTQPKPTSASTLNPATTSSTGGGGGAATKPSVVSFNTLM